MCPTCALYRLLPPWHLLIKANRKLINVVLLKLEKLTSLKESVHLIDKCRFRWKGHLEWLYGGASVVQLLHCVRPQSGGVIKDFLFWLVTVGRVENVVRLIEDDTSRCWRSNEGE